MEPFAAPEFHLERVERILRLLRGKPDVLIKIIDTAGWTRRMLLEAFRRASDTGRSFGDIFGSGRRKGWFFGREVPAVLLVRGERVIDVYPHEENGEIKTVEDRLINLAERLGVKT